MDPIRYRGRFKSRTYWSLKPWLLPQLTRLFVHFIVHLYFLYVPECPLVCSSSLTWNPHRLLPRRTSEGRPPFQTWLGISTSSPIYFPISSSHNHVFGKVPPVWYIRFRTFGGCRNTQVLYVFVPYFMFGPLLFFTSTSSFWLHPKHSEHSPPLT